MIKNSIFVIIALISLVFSAQNSVAKYKKTPLFTMRGMKIKMTPYSFQDAFTDALQMNFYDKESKSPSSFMDATRNIFLKNLHTAFINRRRIKKSGITTKTIDIITANVADNEEQSHQIIEQVVRAIERRGIHNKPDEHISWDDPSQKIKISLSANQIPADEIQIENNVETEIRGKITKKNEKYSLSLEFIYYPATDSIEQFYISFPESLPFNLQGSQLRSKFSREVSQ